MARGRPPKPTALKVIQGNPGKRALNKNAPTPDALAKVPDPPGWFGPVASSIWRQVAPWLVQSKILTDTDLHNLEVFAMAYQRWREAQEDITKNGIVVMGAKQEIKNPACTVANESARQISTFGAALGLDPAARARLKPGEEEDEENEFLTLLQGGKKGR
ncbi:phage terminase small subunit P27 family [Pseudomonas sp. PARCl1]|uniref:phage terminase small subunit P27 family n=1 Tax=Pseudomonas sp. PARCl1 TaxID=2853444 RepID=UPI001C745013|nr:phage terminase small subunit P27 family [Pseudomonas sp. PARCl1]QXM18718.1 terminase small subunit P27 family [Pseudomonas phage PARCL1pr]